MSLTIKITITFLLLLTSLYCNCQVDHSEKGAFMDMKPTTKPILLSPDIISSSLDEYNGTFSPDGKEFFFTTDTPGKGFICQTKLGDDGKWSKAEIAPFSGEFSEYDPIFSPDGDKLYFSSERPIGKDSSGKTNIWYVEKQDSIWSKPKHVQLNEQGTYYSSITHQGHIYFNIWDTGDMYKAINTENGYSVERLSDTLNSTNGEGDPFISPEEDYIIFRGYNNSLGQGDLFISYNIVGEWTNPENLGEPINSEAHEMCPYVTLDGNFLIFSSSRLNIKYPSKANANLDEIRKKHHTSDNGELNIYYISADFIKERRKKYE